MSSMLVNATESRHTVSVGGCRTELESVEDLTPHKLLIFGFET